MREARQRAIKDILQTEAITTQQALLVALKKAGRPADQSTLSRDLAELGVRKMNGRYALPTAGEPDAGEVDLRGVVHGFLPCGPHLLVIRTAIGQAQPVALAIDDKAEPSIVATLAGDDTIFVATKNRKTQTVALRRLETWFGEKRER